VQCLSAPGGEQCANYLVPQLKGCGTDARLLFLLFHVVIVVIVLIVGIVVGEEFILLLFLFFFIRGDVVVVPGLGGWGIQQHKDVSLPLTVRLRVADPQTEPTHKPAPLNQESIALI